MEQSSGAGFFIFEAHLGERSFNSLIRGKGLPMTEQLVNPMGNRAIVTGI
jgi:hypothetical protein